MRRVGEVRVAAVDLDPYSRSLEGAASTTERLVFGLAAESVVARVVRGRPSGGIYTILDPRGRAPASVRIIHRGVLVVGPHVTRKGYPDVAS